MEPASKAVYALFRDTPRHGDWVVACLQAAWPALLGETLAPACRPRSLAHARLTIEIVDPMWADAVRHLEGEILARIGEATGGLVRSLVIECARG